MRNFLFALAFIYIPFTLTAQFDDLLKNADVSYLATFESEHDFRLTDKSNKAKRQLLKFSQPTDNCIDFSTDNWLAKWLLDGIIQGRYPAYKDPSLLEPLSQQALTNRVCTIDTVITFNPETYEEKMQVIRNDISASEIVSFRTSQAVFYEKKSGTFKTRLLAIAPMVMETDPTGKPLRVVPLAWLSMGGKPADGLTPQSPDVIWAMLLIDNGNPLEISKLSIKKNEAKKTFPEMLYQEATSMKHAVKSTEKYGCGEKLSKLILEEMTHSKDTVINFDPGISEETMRIVNNEFNPAEDIKQVSLVQEWYYDNSQNRVANRLKAIAHRVDVIDQNGTFIYTRSIFYLHCSEKL